MPTFTFNPDRVAYFEAAGWRAYYERNWPRMLYIIVALSQEQFKIPFPYSLQAAYYVVRAAAAWTPLDHDPAKVRFYYTQFYKMARHYSGLTFDPVRAGHLETEYADVHRRLSLTNDPDKSDFIETMVALHSELFGISPAQARPSAELRVLANNIVDLISSKTSLDPEADWFKLEGYLQDCYRSIHKEITA